MGLRIVLAGGGSGGHIYPALAIYQAMKEADPSLEVLYLGTRHGLEASLVPNHQLPFRAIHAQGMLGQGWKKQTLGAASVLWGGVEAVAILRQFRPDLVIGTGGYVTWPVGMAAVVLGVGLVIQEQNVWPGLTNRLLSRFAALVMTPFEESRAYFSHPRRVKVIANPVPPPVPKTREQARQSLGLDPAIRLLMATGGSQGAAGINDWVLDLLPAVIDAPDLGLLWATGPRYYPAVAERLAGAYGPLDPRRIRVQAYFDAIGQCYRASDLFLGRAGAMTIADCLAYGLPMVLVPSPHVSEDHQTRNAGKLEKQGAALAMVERDLGPRATERVLKLVADGSALAVMAENTRRISDPRAADKMAKLILDLNRRPRGGESHRLRTNRR